MTFRKYLLCILALLAVSLPAIAEEYWFVVWHKSRAPISFSFADCPKVTHDSENIIITTSVGTLSYPKSEIHKFTIDTQNTGGIESTNTAKAHISQQSNSISLSGFNAGSIVRVFSISGQFVLTDRICNDGTLTLDLSPLSGGIYIISTESITYKFIKR